MVVDLWRGMGERQWESRCRCFDRFWGSEGRGIVEGVWGLNVLEENGRGDMEMFDRGDLCEGGN